MKITNIAPMTTQSRLVACPNVVTGSASAANAVLPTTNADTVAPKRPPATYLSAKRLRTESSY
ncbi:unannotated protein [freshwater metagenome]|uniref:Unannotated protein n=1 Tax=freshwater metagenome TaxID=449393 RepID=A0A6J6XJK8_9ZZZZ